jgi:hypothetical protein
MVPVCEVLLLLLRRVRIIRNPVFEIQVLLCCPVSSSSEGECGYSRGDKCVRELQFEVSPVKNALVENLLGAEALDLERN